MKVKPHQRQSLLKQIPKSSVKAEEVNGHMVVSFKHIDQTQGQTFQQWETEGILADALETLSHYCKDTLQRQCSTDSFKHYKGFPPNDKTDYHQPSHVPQDADWASMHINGKQCLVGHIFKNTFYVVFLDKDHRFWISDLQER